MRIDFHTMLDTMLNERGGAFAFLSVCSSLKYNPDRSELKVDVRMNDEVFSVSMCLFCILGDLKYAMYNMMEMPQIDVSD